MSCLLFLLSTFILPVIFGVVTYFAFGSFGFAIIVSCATAIGVLHGQGMVIRRWSDTLNGVSNDLS